MPTKQAPATPAAHAIAVHARLTPLAFAINLACATLAVASFTGPAQAQAAAATQYDIPAGSLAEALNRFAQQSGAAIVVDAGKVQGLRTQGLKGSYDVDEGFNILLKGSGYSIGKTAAGYVLVPAAAPAPDKPEQVSEAKEATLGEVQVSDSMAATLPGKLPTAYAGGQVAHGGRVGLLGDKDVMDTPFNITNYTQQTMQDQQVRSIADVVVNDPSVRNVNPWGGRFDQFSIRGFQVINSDIAFGGLYGMLSTYSVAVEMAERVEVLKGPNALLNGMSPNGSIGGGINIVPKRADDRPLTQFTASYASDAQFGGHLDLGRRFGADNSFGVRFNGAYRNGDIAVDNQSLELGLGEFGLDFRGERIRLSADLGHQERSVDAQLERVGVASSLAAPDAPDADSNFAQPWTYAKARDTHVVLRGEYDLTPDSTVYAAAGARRGRSDFLRHAVTVNNAQGNFTSTPFQFLFNEDVRTAEAGLRVRFDTGPVWHALNLSASQFRLEWGTGRQNFAAFSSNIYNPIVRPEPVLGGLSDNLPKANETVLSSLALADTLSFLQDRVQLTLGARHQRVKVDAFNTTTGARTSSYDEHAVTLALGLVVKPGQNVSLYANYIEGLTQGPTAPTTAANAGEVFAPFKSEQVEAGVKVDFGRVTTTLSTFQIRQPSTLTDPGTNVFGLDGKQRNRGLELNVFGEPREGTRLLGGVMLLDGELVKTASGTNDGNTAPGAPRISLNLGGEWDTPFLPGLTLLGRAIYTSSQYLNAANTQEIPGWTRYDLGARYALRGGVPVTIRANVENLFDKSYWASAAASGLTLGTPRTVLLSVTFDF